MVSSSFLFGNTNSLFATLQNFGVSVSFVDATEAAHVAAAIQPNTRLVFVETIANPVTQIADLAGIGKLCAERKLVYVVDNTMTSPWLFVPKTAVQPAVPGVKVGYPPGWRGGTMERVQGGGLRLSNLRTTLPGNLEKIEDAYGPLLLALAGGYSARRKPLAQLAIAVILAHLLVVALTFADWDGRWLLYVLPLIGLLAAVGVSGLGVSSLRDLR